MGKLATTHEGVQTAGAVAGPCREGNIGTGLVEIETIKSHKSTHALRANPPLSSARMVVM